jgi:hypothetical protein
VLIHGYGSNSAASKFRVAILVHLWERKNRNEISGIIPGESWNHVDEESKEFLRYVPELIIDVDFDRRNNGVTLVVL